MRIIVRLRMKRAQPTGSELGHLTVMVLSLSRSAINTASSACRLGAGCKGNKSDSDAAGVSR